MASPALGKTLGAVYIGATIAAILFGITILQTAIYYQRFRKDWWVYRYSVALLWILDALHVALSTHALYFYLIENFGNLEVLNEVVWSFKLQLLFDTLTVVGVQTIYAVRLCRLGCHFHRVVPFFVVLVVCGGYAAGICVCYDVFVIRGFSDISSISTTIIAAFSATTAVDFIISALMCYYLQVSKTAVPHYSSMTTTLLVLMRLVLISGLATSTCSLITLITFLTLPDSLVFLGFNFILPKLYINSLLAMLNARKELRELPTENASDGETLLTALRFNKNFGDSTGDQSSRQIESEDVEPGTVTVS